MCVNRHGAWPMLKPKLNPLEPTVRVTDRWRGVGAPAALGVPLGRRGGCWVIWAQDYGHVGRKCPPEEEPRVYLVTRSRQPPQRWTACARQAACGHTAAGCFGACDCCVVLHLFPAGRDGGRQRFQRGTHRVGNYLDMQVSVSLLPSVGAGAQWMVTLQRGLGAGGVHGGAWNLSQLEMVCGRLGVAARPGALAGGPGWGGNFGTFFPRG